MTTAVDTTLRAESAALADARAWASAQPAHALVSARLPLPQGQDVALADGDLVFVSPEGAAQRARLAGFGVAAEVRAYAGDRFATIQRDGSRLLSRLPTFGGARPRLIGGFSFEADDVDATWAPFGTASFVLPRFLVEEEAGQSSVTITAEARSFGAVSTWIDELRERARRARVGGDATSGTTDRPRLSDALYEAQVTRALAAIARGDVEKVVLARRERVATAAGRRPSAAVRALLAEPGVTVFAHAAGDRVFLGATPELLVAAHGDRVDVEAVAGSRPRRGDDALELAELRSSEKDAREHQVVRDAILRALGPLSEDARAGATTTRTLGFVHHLVTPIAARRGDRRAHVLEIAAALHPTPAMAGWPAAAARAYIRAEEGFSRGGYAAPFGWFDAHGDGEFVVGIRSALIDPDGAWLFAGAGIVRGSEPSKEAAETRAKLGTILSALERLG